MINIKIEKFEGPLGLLLHIIEKEELDITEISLANVADQYVLYIRRGKYVDPEETADFLVVAAKLLYIKSKSLLPYLYSEEEDEDIEEFEKQLKMYKEFLDAAKKIETIIGKKKFMFSKEFNRKNFLNNLNLFSPPKKLDKKELKEIFEEIIGKIKPVTQELKEKKLEASINIEDKILEIRNNLINKIKISFNKILKNASSKTEIIVNFLAVLELIKQKDVKVDQQSLFSEIMIKKND